MLLIPLSCQLNKESDLYRRRWSIEDAFAITKRLLGLSYLWVGDTNGVQIQLFALLDFLRCS